MKWALRVGIVVATHPEDHSVDLVMADDGSRVVGAQALNWSASERSGTVDMPAVPEKKDKWDITGTTGQEMKAIVGFVGKTPVVIGYLYPQINQILHQDSKLRYSRHQSDVESLIDGDGNIQIAHPSGMYIRIGEEADKVDMEGKNFDKSSKIDRNKSRKVNVRISLADQEVELTMTKDGNVRLTMNGNLEVEAKGTMSFTADNNISVTSATKIAFDAPIINMNEGGSGG